MRAYAPGFEPMEPAASTSQYAPGFEPLTPTPAPAMEAPPEQMISEAETIPTLTEAYGSLVRPLTSGVAALAQHNPIATLMQYLTGTPDETMRSGAQSAAEMFVPQTPTGGASAIGMLPFGGPLGRIFGAAGGAAIGSMAEGNGPAEVATDAAVHGAGAGVGEGLGRLGSWLARSTGGAKTRIAHDDAAQLLSEVRSQAPGLAQTPTTGTPSEQVRQLATGAGRKGVGAEKERVTLAIEEALGGQDIHVPSLTKHTYGASMPEGPAWDATGTATPTRISLRAANEELTAIGDGLRHMDIGDRALRERMIQQDYKALANEIRQGLDEVAPGMGEAWNVGQVDARAGYAYVKLLRDKGAYRAGNTGTEQNTAHLQSKMIDPRTEETLRWRLKEGGLESLTDTLTRGAGLGRVDINAAGRGGTGQSLGEFARRPSAGSFSGVLTPLRAVLPNAGARYVGAPGRVPYAMDPGLQLLMDILGGQSAEQFRRAQQGQPVQLGPMP